MYVISTVVRKDSIFQFNLRNNGEYILKYYLDNVIREIFPMISCYLFMINSDSDYLLAAFEFLIWSQNSTGIIEIVTSNSVFLKRIIISKKLYM